MNAEHLLTHFDRIADAPDAVPRLRRFILDLAVRGKLVEQDQNDEPASELLKRVAAEKRRMVEVGKVRRRKKTPLIDSSSLLFGAPLGWVWTRLLDLSRKIHYGFTASANQQIADVRLLRITDIQHNKVEWHSVPGCEIDEKTLPSFKLETGDILIARTGGTVGKSFLVAELPVVAVFASYLIRVQGSHEIYTRYLKLFLESPIYWTQLREGTRGAGQPNVNGQTLGTMLVPLPPLAEQYRIVTKVDELMALCDRLETLRKEREATRDRLATASLAHLNAPASDSAVFQSHAAFALNNLTPLTTRPDQIKALRQTILNLAVRGKLVGQDPNDEPASELLKQIAAEKKRLVEAGKVSVRKIRARDQESEAAFVPPQGWALSKLGEIAIKITDGAHKTPTYVREGVPFVSVKDFSTGSLDLTNTRFITKEEHNILYKRCDPRRGDILLGRIGTLGKAVLVTTDVEFSLFVSVGLIRFDHRYTIPEYFLILLNSPFVEAEFDRIKIGGGTHTNKLNLGDLHTVTLVIPPLAEQHRIVAKVDELMAVCDRLEAGLAGGEETQGRWVEAALWGALETDTGREAT